MNVRHVAYCTGPAQFLYLLCALETAEVDPDQCTVMVDGPVGTDLHTSMVRLVRANGMRLWSLPSTSGSAIQVELARAIPGFLRRRAIGGLATIFYYSRGVRYSMPVLSRYLRVGPAEQVEFYDGFRTPIVVPMELGDSRGQAPREGTRGAIKQMLWQSLGRPSNRYLMPREFGWELTADEVRSSRTTYFTKTKVLAAARRVGAVLDRPLPPSSLKNIRTFILTGMSAERYPQVDLRSEIRLYRDLISAIREDKPVETIGIKPHLRSSVGKLEALRLLGAATGVTVLPAQGIVEAQWLTMKSSYIVVLSEPTTALIAARSLGLARPVSLGMELMVSYLGWAYREAPYKDQDHTFMGSMGIPQVNTLSDLSAQIALDDPH